MAGFFGLFDYARPGRGVSKNEPQEGRAVRFFKLTGRKFGKLVQLNLLYIAFCLPVVTVGPATAGMCYILRQFADEKPVFLFSDFWERFRLNLRQSLAYGLFSMVFFGLTGLSGWFYLMNQSAYPWMLAPLSLCAFLTLLFLMAGFYIYPMIVSLDLKLLDIIKNGLLLAILRIKVNLITLLAVAVPTLLLIGYLPYTIPLFFLFAFSFPWFVIVYNAWPGIRQYAVAPKAEPDEQEGPDSLFQDEPEQDRT